VLGPDVFEEPFKNVPIGNVEGFAHPGGFHRDIQEGEDIAEATAWDLTELAPQQDVSTPPIAGDLPASSYGGPQTTLEGPGTPRDTAVERLAAEGQRPYYLTKELRKLPNIGDRGPDRVHITYHIVQTEEKGAMVATYRTVPVTTQPQIILPRDNDRKRALLTVVYSTPGDGDFVAIGNRELAGFTWDPTSGGGFPPMNNAWLIGCAATGGQDTEYSHINAASAGTVLSTVPVELSTFTVNTPDTVAATVTLYDGPVAGGVVIAVIKLPTSGGAYAIPFNLETRTGLSYVATGFTGSGDTTAVYSPSQSAATNAEQTIEIKHCADIWACYVPNGSTPNGLTAIVGILSEINDRGLKSVNPANQSGPVSR
jgi:hypothetical protein